MNPTTYCTYAMHPIKQRNLCGGRAWLLMCYQPYKFYCYTAWTGWKGTYTYTLLNILSLSMIRLKATDS